MTFGAYHYDTEHRLLYRGGEAIGSSGGSTLSMTRQSPLPRLTRRSPPHSLLLLRKCR